MPVDWVVTPAEEDMTAEQLEEAAQRLLAKAKALRNADKREPQIDGSVVQWEHCSFIFVAIRKNGRWWTTARGESFYGATWFELCKRFPALREGNFAFPIGWVDRAQVSMSVS